jgi:hypothetical protein
MRTMVRLPSEAAASLALAVEIRALVLIATPAIRANSKRILSFIIRSEEFPHVAGRRFAPFADIEARTSTLKSFACCCITGLWDGQSRAAIPDTAPSQSRGLSSMSCGSERRPGDDQRLSGNGQSR